MVFVPYRGLIFLNSKKDFVGELQEVFPSPTGDLYFSIPFETPYTAKTRFPSPTEDLYFSMVTQTIVVTVQIVSVPYRGLIFLNSISILCNNEKINHFRPLPGTYISQLTHRRTINGLSNFRPLPGTYISQ